MGIVSTEPDETLQDKELEGLVRPDIRDLSVTFETIATHTLSKTFDLSVANEFSVSALGPLTKTFGRNATNEISEAERLNKIELGAGNNNRVGTQRTDDLDWTVEEENRNSAMVALRSAMAEETNRQGFSHINFSRIDFSRATSEVFGDVVKLDDEGLLIDDEGNYLSQEDLVNINNNSGVDYNFQTIDGAATDEMLVYFAMDYVEGEPIDMTQIPPHIQAIIDEKGIITPTAQDYIEAGEEHLATGKNPDNENILTMDSQEYIDAHSIINPADVASTSQAVPTNEPTQQPVPAPAPSY